MLDKNKKKLSTADLVIASFFGESSKEIYGEDYEKLEKYLKEHKIDNIPWFESEEGAEYAKKAIEKFAPLIAEIAEKNRKSKVSFAKLKELITKNNNSEIAASIKEIVESVENGIQDVITSAKKSIVDTWKVINLSSSSDGLKLIPAGATRGDAKTEAKKSLPFIFISGQKQRYDGVLVYEEDTVKVIIDCNDISKEFFLISQGFVISESPKDGRIEFIVPDKGDYLLTDDGQGFMAFSLK